MAGQLKVGGNIIASHSGVEGAGEVTLQNVTLGDSAVPSHSMNFRNKIINGDMRIAQRGTTGTTTDVNNYLLDRFSLSRFGGYPDNATQSQDTDSPSGHLKSLKFIRNSGHTLTGTNGSALTYAVEGNDIYHFNWGSSSAKAVTLSFWVKSNKTGNFSLILTDTNSAYDIGKLYTILEPNTWEHKKVPIEAPTSGGTFNTDNTAGLYISWGFGATDSSRIAQGSTWGVSNTSGTSKSMVTGASTSLATDSGATFYITGVQLEEGTVPTPFEHRPIGVEQSLCERYYEIVHDAYGEGHRPLSAAWTTANSNCFIPFRTRKRSTSSNVSITGTMQIYNGTWGDATGVVLLGSAGHTGVTLDVRRTGGYTARYVYFIRNGKVTVDAEL